MASNLWCAEVQQKGDQVRAGKRKEGWVRGCLQSGITGSFAKRPHSENKDLDAKLLLQWSFESAPFATSKVASKWQAGLRGASDLGERIRSASERFLADVLLWLIPHFPCVYRQIEHKSALHESSSFHA